MYKLFKNGICFVPEYAGRMDVLTAYNKVLLVDSNINAGSFPEAEIIDVEGKIVCPGFIDQHLHITGGGGEDGPLSRIGEIQLEDIVKAGITTVIGLLGMDDLTRNIASLIPKSRALEMQGLTSYIYTGSYSVPPATLTGSISSDIALIDRIVGAGEIAISDYRSSCPTPDELRKIASEVLKGSMLSAKRPVLHIHVGDGKEGLKPLTGIIKSGDFPVEMFVPTHLNRNASLFEEAMAFARFGGRMDLTAGENSESGYTVAEAVGIMFHSRISLDRVTVSSDGNGSVPKEGGGFEKGSINKFHEDIRSLYFDSNIPFEKILKMVTKNVADIFGFYPVKGALKKGSDADIIVLDKNNFNIETVMAQGKVLLRNGKLDKSG